MRKLKINFGSSGSPRDEAIQKGIMQIITASVAGFGAAPMIVGADDSPHIGFTLNEEHESTGACRVDLTTTGVANHDHGLMKQFNYIDALVAGQKPMDDPWGKIKTLDTGDFTYAIIVPDGMENPEFPAEHVLTESQVFSDPTILDRVSHALLVSPDRERPLMCERQVAYRCCLVFYIGSDSKGALGQDRNVMCDSFDDFLTRAESLDNNKSSSEAFEAALLNDTFSENVVTGREPRTWIASLLSDKVGEAFGMFELHRGDERLLARTRGQA